MRHLLRKHNIITSRLALSKRDNAIIFNILSILIVIAFFFLISNISLSFKKPLNSIVTADFISLESSNLFYYSFRTLVRMLIAIVCSIIFAVFYGTLAAKNKYAEQILVPLLDILQSVPILGYISFTVTLFLNLFPGKVIGAEMAAIFAIFTSQVWNIIFSVYQSLKSFPKEFNDICEIFYISKWEKFWRFELPYCMPSLTWNASVSMAGGWFFVVASEAISVGDNQINLPGIGSYIAFALKQKNIEAILWSVLAISIVVILFNKLFLNPLMNWSNKYHYEDQTSQITPQSWFTKKIVNTYLFRKISKLFQIIENYFIYLFPIRQNNRINITINSNCPKPYWFDYIFKMILSFILICISAYIFKFIQHHISWKEVIVVFKNGIYTFSRIIILIVLASLLWLPIGIKIGQSKKLSDITQLVAQFLASFPVNLIFPIAVIFIHKYNLSPEIWLPILIIINAQWYILFNVVAGTSAMPSELKNVISNFKIKGLVWWFKVMIPSVIPYYITGAITASGGAWNSSIIAEVISYGSDTIKINGLGSYIADQTAKGDFPKIALGVGMMSIIVVILNRLFWQPLYDYCLKKFQL